MKFLKLREWVNDNILKQIRYPIAEYLNRYNYCWADLVMWAEGYKSFEHVGEMKGCKSCGYCGKCLDWKDKRKCRSCCQNIADDGYDYDQCIGCHAKSINCEIRWLK